MDMIKCWSLCLLTIHQNSQSFVIPITVANPEDKYHPTLEINFFHHSFRQANTLTQTPNIYCLNLTSHNKLYRKLSEIDWINELSGYDNDLDQCIMKFYKLLYNCFVACEPKSFILGILNAFQN